MSIKTISITAKSVLNANDQELLEQQMLIKNLTKFFFEKYEMINRMKEIVERRSDITLSFLDWIVVQRSKVKPIIFSYDDEIVDIRAAYVNQLKSLRKRGCDAFSRKNKFEFRYGNEENDIIFTNVKQLSFFKFLFTTGIMDYIDEHSEFLDEFKKEKRKRKFDEIKYEKQPVEKAKVFILNDCKIEF